MPAKNNLEEQWKLEQRELSQPLRFIAGTMLPTAALRLNERHTMKGQREGENIEKYILEPDNTKCTTYLGLACGCDRVT